MNETPATSLQTLSRGLESLVQTAVGGIVAVKALAYRVSTGICIGPNLIAVADHAVKREEDVPILTSSGDEIKGTLLGRVPSVDVAFLIAGQSSLNPLPPAPEDSLKTGSLIAVVGLTTDVGPSASLGILGAVGERRRTWRGGVLDRFIRLDVNLYPSQVGAAVLNTQGQLIGLATPALLRHSAVAVPLGTLKRLSEELLKEGRVRHGHLGVAVQTVAFPESLRNKVSLDSRSGLMIMSITPDGPAEKAGMQLGDILVSLGTQQLSTVEDLQDALEGTSIGAVVPALIIRGGETVQLSVTIAERPRSDKRSQPN
jgi:S1-C subfamily serine protease